MTMSVHTDPSKAEDRREVERRKAQQPVEGADRREAQRRGGKDRRGAPRV
jgi:TfoX/Sxy family transcriptional regulator of competence genes